MQKKTALFYQSGIGTTSDRMRIWTANYSAIILVSYPICFLAGFRLKADIGHWKRALAVMLDTFGLIPASFAYRKIYRDLRIFDWAHLFLPI